MVSPCRRRVRRGRRRGRRRNSSSRECNNLTCFNIAFCFDAGTTTCVQNKQPVYLLVCLCSCVLVCLSQWCHLKEQIKHLSQFGSCMLPCEIACAQETRETKPKTKNNANSHFEPTTKPAEHGDHQQRWGAVLNKRREESERGS